MRLFCLRTLTLNNMADGSVLVGEIEEQIEVAPVPFDANLTLIMWTRNGRWICDCRPSLCGFRLISLVTLTMTFLLAVIGRRHTSAASDLLGMEYDERSEPFAGATGVVHPLLSESVTQFQAQAYREMLPSGGPVRCQTVGAETEEIVAQAERVKNYMNYMLTYEMEEYDPETDQMLFYLPIVGSTFKKVYFDPLLQRGVSKFVHAEDLVVPYGATDLLTAPRITHVIRMDSNEMRKMQIAGFYRDVDLPMAAKTN